MNGRFLMSKYSNDGHKLNHEILSPCTKEMIRLNLASPSRAKCLLTWGPEETTYPAFCGDGIIQGHRSKFRQMRARPSISALVGEGCCRVNGEF